MLKKIKVIRIAKWYYDCPYCECINEFYDDVPMGKIKCKVCDKELEITGVDD